MCTLSVGALLLGFYLQLVHDVQVGLGMSHLLINLCPHPLDTLVQLARGKLPLPLPKLNTLGKVLGLLKGIDVLGLEILGCWPMSISLSEVMSTTTGIPLAWVSLPSSESLQLDLTLIFLCVFCGLGHF